MKIYAIILGTVLTPFAVKSATEARGYNAVGGEYLLIPLFLLIACLIKVIDPTAKARGFRALKRM